LSSEKERGRTYGVPLGVPRGDSLLKEGRKKDRVEGGKTVRPIFRKGDPPGSGKDTFLKTREKKLFQQSPSEEGNSGKGEKKETTSLLRGGGNSQQGGKLNENFV